MGAAQPPDPSHPPAMVPHVRLLPVPPLRVPTLVAGLLPVLLGVLAQGAPAALAAQAAEADIAALRRAVDGFEWRAIGPANMGGRTVDIAGVPGDPTTLYMATASGGLWRTTDRGTTWESVFDDGGTLSLGAVALAPSDRNVVWLGTGENNPRNSASIGDGVYRSTDGGDTWTHLGLEETRRTGRIRVHPRDPDHAWVAALGTPWGPSEARGVYRTTDGGGSWERVLFVNGTTGASDLAVDPSNPRILFAGMYDHLRRPWHFRSGGPGSGLWRSKDGGESWTELTYPALDNGLPTGTLGRIGVAVASSDPDVVYAVVEAEEGVLWRSDDGGESWREVSDDRAVIGRPFYYADIRVDPTDANTVWAVSGGLLRSVDGGRTFDRLAANIHGDHQALWIDPEDPDRVIDGNDGGFHASYDGGESWDFINTVPIAQFYHVESDSRHPYRVCGGLQDNDVWCGPAKTWTVAGILRGDWYEIQGPGDGMYVQIDPRDPDVIYSDTHRGNVVRVDLRTGEDRPISPQPVTVGGAARNDAYRFNWNSPLLLSPHDPDVLFLAGNVVFRTGDGGQSWTVVSPDLTRADSAKLGPSGGPITMDNTGAETHATITALDQSPLDPEVLWVGTDDGNFQVTRDGGATWTEVGRNLPAPDPDAGRPDAPADERWVSSVEASRRGAGVAYVAVDRHRSDDPAPYLFRTEDFGESWTRITAGIPPLHWVHVIREDPRDTDLLYAGTELGVFASWDRGDRWVDLRSGLPPVAVRDVEVHDREGDLVLATHGRSLYVLDDPSLLRTLPEAVATGAYLATPGRPAVRFVPWGKRFRFDLGDRTFVGENPPYGALLDVHLPEDLPDDSVRLGFTVRDEVGDEVRSFEAWGRAGTNRTAWDLRHDGLPGPGDEAVGGGSDDGVYRLRMEGPLVLPGPYEVAVVAGASDTLRTTVEVVLDPRHEVPRGDLVAQRDALLRVVRAAGRGAEAVRRADRALEALGALAGDLEESHPELAGDASALADSLRDARGVLTTPEDDDEGRARLLEQLRQLHRGLDQATARPTAAQAGALERLDGAVSGAVDAVDRLLDAPLRALETRLDAEGVPHVRVGAVTRG